VKLKQVLERALAETAALWEPIGRASRGIHAAAQVLANGDQQSAKPVRHAFVRILRSIGVTKRQCGPLEPALNHFLKLTRSYQAGLFQC
jgi:hypothetical protein